MKIIATKAEPIGPEKGIISSSFHCNELQHGALDRTNESAYL